MVKDYDIILKAVLDLGVLSKREWQNLVDTLTTIRKQVALTDGTTIAFDMESFHQRKAFLSTAETAINFTLSNCGEVLNMVVKPSGGDCTITFDGTGLKFVDMDAQAAPAATLDVVCTDAVYNEISLSDSGDTSGGDRVLLVVKK